MSIASNLNPRITISLPCYQRPKRTVRAIESIINQTLSGWELLITTDGDEDLYNTLLEYFTPAKYATTLEKMSEFYDKCTIRVSITKDNYVLLSGRKINAGSWGTDIRNRHIQDAKGRYFMFMGNDDVLQSTHLENILPYIEDQDLDMISFDTWIEPNNAPRNTQFREGMIGHSDIFVRTEFLKTMPMHLPFYGHDWKLVRDIMANTEKYKKISGLPQTYIVKSIPHQREASID